MPVAAVPFQQETELLEVGAEHPLFGAHRSHEIEILERERVIRFQPGHVGVAERQTADLKLSAGRFVLSPAAAHIGNTIPTGGIRADRQAERIDLNQFKPVIAIPEI